MRGLRSLPLVFVALATACASSPSGPDPIQGLPRELTPREAEVLRASNGFGFDLFGTLADDTPDDNVFVSPLSASMALGMTANGASGGTWTAMAGVLGFEEMTVEEMNRAYRDLIDLLVGLDPAVETLIANAIWHRTGFDLRGPFVEDVRSHFDAEVASLDFTSPEALGVVNGWASANTRGRIPKILERIDPAWTLILMNAVYFKGLWTEPFDPDNTRTGDFRRADGTTRSVPFMSQMVEKFPGVATETYTAAELPYGGEAFAMVVVVPTEGHTLEELVAGLDAAAWDALVAGFGEPAFHVVMPRFELEYEADLVDVLTRLGMGVAFTAGADFSNLSEHPFWIDLVKQKTFLKVDEEGTEAAAVTVVAGPTSMPPTVIADRPFLIAIRERFSGAILFLGQVTDPGA
ncbi:MAG TPA: serpin family protein [Gemmatimonadota bacterium]|nr:serpin family protein [Gemmatimonadota bacterium]